MNFQLESELHVKQFVNGTTPSRGGMFEPSIFFRCTVQYLIICDPIDGSHLGFDNGRNSKMFRIAPSVPLTPKCRDSHQIHHHISLSCKIMDKNGCLTAAVLNFQDGGQKVLAENGNIGF